MAVLEGIAGNAEAGPLATVRAGAVSDEPAPKLLGCSNVCNVDASQKALPAQSKDLGFEDISIESTSEVDCPSGERQLLNVNFARQIALFSMVASLIVALLALTMGIAEEAVSLVGFGGEMLLDGISSAFVLWRFKRPKQRPGSHLQNASEAKEELRRRMTRDARRERNSSIGIGATFIVLSILLLMSAAVKLSRWDAHDPKHQAEEHTAAVYGGILVWVSVVIFGFLAVIKFQLASKLQSQVLEKDAFCSVLGAALGLIVGITTLVELLAEDDPDSLALVDPAAGAIIALIMLVEGCRTLWHNRPGGEHAEEPMPLSDEKLAA